MHYLCVSVCGDADAVDVVYSAAPGSTPDETQKSMTFFREISRLLPIGEDKIRVGVVPEDCRELSEFRIEQSGDTDDILDQLDRYIKEETKISFARQLKYMRKVSFQSNHGSRDTTSDVDVKKRAVVLISENDDLDRARKEAYRLKSYADVELFAVGIGTDPDFQKSVRSIVSRPARSHAIFISDYNELPTVLDNVQRFICPASL